MNKCGQAHDYAHEGAGFLTWHRLFLLWFEREVRKELNKPNFKLYYWDWRVREDITKLLNHDRFGSILDGGEIDGGFGDNWRTVCWQRESTYANCDPYTEVNVYPTLRRCPTREYCLSPNSTWPTDEEVEMALEEDVFDMMPYNVQASGGLRNYLEGFKPGNCSELRKEPPFCDKDCGERLLHNSVSQPLSTFLGKALINIPRFE